MEVGTKVEELIARAKRRAAQKENKLRSTTSDENEHQRNRATTTRRDAAFDRLNLAIDRFMASPGDKEEKGDLAVEVIEFVVESRISMAEAMVDLADRGFFSIRPFFKVFDSKSQGGRALWRGYVHNEVYAFATAYGSIDGQSCRTERTQDNSVEVSINVARKCSGGYVAHAYTDRQDGIGESTEEEGAHVAMARSYIQVYRSRKHELTWDRVRDIMIPVLESYFATKDTE
jgi:hypothetical protein